MTTGAPDPIKTAAVVEAKRVDRAETIELQREERAAVLESLRIETAALLEEDRKQHNARFEARWAERSKIVNRRLLGLFLALVAVFGLLAYRSEVNSNRVDQANAALAAGLHAACVSRAETATRYNEGREALVQMVAGATRTPALTPDQMESLIKQLRDGLLLPVETCDPV